MHSYSVRDVERLLRLSRSTIRGLTSAGFLTPARGSRRELRFSFQDLIVLRAARALIDGKIPRTRIRRALDDLRSHLPDTLPLSGLSISAVGDRVVVREGKSRWQVDDGQYLLALDVSIADGELHVVERKQAVAANPAAAQPAASKPVATEDWFEKGLQLEGTDPASAAKAYEHAVSDDPDNVAAWVNWGRLLHEKGDLQGAVSFYSRAIKQCGPVALLQFNLGVVLDDQGKTAEAIEAYQAAIVEDPNLADCHYNLARLYEALGKPQHAIRHLGQYRRLTNAEPQGSPSS